MDPKNKKSNETKTNAACNDDDPYRDVGRRLFAAVVSAQLGPKSIDYALKKHTTARLHPSWGRLSLRLQRNMQATIAKRIFGATSKPERDGIHLVAPHDPESS